MGTRGRKSSAALTTKPLSVLSEHRPSPPAELTQAEAAIWRDTTGCLPANWFTKAQAPLLIALCRHTARSGLLAEQIAKFRPEWLKSNEGLARFDKLLAMAERETRTVNSISRALRLTNQSRYTPHAAATAARKDSGTSRPWDD